MIPALEVAGLNVAYGVNWVLQDVDMSVEAGSLTAIVGPNGAGKSTLLKAVLGIVPKLSGVVSLAGQPFTGADPRVAYVPQRESVDWDFPVSVEEVALMGTYGHMRMWGRPSRADRDRAAAALKDVQLTPLRHRQIGQLSGGQQQRLFLARALAQNASLLMLDEPFSGVDAASQEAILGILEGFAQRGGTVLAVHHDIATVQRAFDHAILLNRTLVAQGPVSSALNRANLKAAYGDWFDPQEDA